MMRRERWRRRLAQDEGTTLVELMVGMMLMVTFMGMFTTAIVLMSNSMNKAQAINLSSSQLNIAFSNLDKTVRYAAAITSPGIGTPSGDWYVEIRTTNTGSEVCTQLRVDIASQQLQDRTWTVVNTVASAPSAWIPIASGMSNGAAAAGSPLQPFVLIPPSTNVVFQQLTVNLVSPAGNGAGQTTSMSTFSFTALNSTATSAASACQQQGRS